MRRGETAECTGNRGARECAAVKLFAAAGIGLGTLDHASIFAALLVQRQVRFGFRELKRVCGPAQHQERFSTLG